MGVNMNLISQPLEVTNFSFGDESFTPILINNEPWFIAAEICNIIGLPQVHKALQQHVPNESYILRLTPNDPGFTTLLNNLAKYSLYFANEKDLSQVRKLTLINEPGLYALTFRSQKLKAQQFTDWVCSDVLPTLRKTGTYTVPKSSNQTLISLFSDSLIQLINHTKEQSENIEKLQNEVTRLIDYTKEQATQNTELQNEVKYLKNEVDLFETKLSEMKAISGTRAGRAPGLRTQFALDYARYKILEEGIFDEDIPQGTAPITYVHAILAKDIKSELPFQYIDLPDEEIISKNYVAKLIKERLEMLNARLRYQVSEYPYKPKQKQKQK